MAAASLLPCNHITRLISYCAATPHLQDALGQRRTSFSRIRDAGDKKWRTSAMEAWIASDASAVVEHTKRWVQKLAGSNLGSRPLLVHA